MTDAAKEPAGLVRLRSASGRPAHHAPLDPALGAWARTLSAAKPGAALLHLCEASDEMALWIHSGMDLESRLVIVTPEREGAKALEDALGSELRVTCHSQQADAFLDDIRSHRFGLIVNDGTPKDRERIERLWEVLAPGGLLLVCGLDGAAETSGTLSAAAWIGERPDAALARHAARPGTLLAARLVPVPAPTRRGGRRARREPGSVTALRP